MTAIDIGISKAGSVVSLPLSKANRHGLVTGSTGTGKTTTLQALAEGFSRAPGADSAETILERTLEAQRALVDSCNL